MGLGSPCLDLDGLSSSDDDIGTLGGLSDLLVTLLCGADEVFSPVIQDQVLSDVDFPPEPDKRQVVRRRDASLDVLLVDAPPVRRLGDPRRSVARVPPGKCMPGEVSMTISPVPPSLDMTVTCASGVVPMSTQPPVVIPVLAMSTATVTSREVDVHPGLSRVSPVPRLGPASTSVGERVPAVVQDTLGRALPNSTMPHRCDCWNSCAMTCVSRRPLWICRFSTIVLSCTIFTKCKKCTNKEIRYMCSKCRFSGS